LLTRIAAFGVGGLMVGAIFMVHMPYGFFMNWMGARKARASKYHLLVLAMAGALLLRGAERSRWTGRWRSKFVVSSGG